MLDQFDVLCVLFHGLRRRAVKPPVLLLLGDVAVGDLLLLELLTLSFRILFRVLLVLGTLLLHIVVDDRNIGPCRRRRRAGHCRGQQKNDRSTHLSPPGWSSRRSGEARLPAPHHTFRAAPGTRARSPAVRKAP